MTHMRAYTSVLPDFARSEQWATHPALTVSRAVLLGLIGLFGVFSITGLSIPWRIQLGIYLIGMVALNLPHGGYEHFNNLRSRLRRFQLRYLVLYFVGIAGFAGLFFTTPVIGLGLALAVAITKGGYGGLHVLDVTSGTEHLETRLQRALAVLVRGGAIMLVPMVFWPGTFLAFGAYMVAIFDQSAVTGLSHSFDLVRTVAGAGYGAALIAHLGLGWYRWDGGVNWPIDAVETVLLAGYFAVVPVVVAVGLYFPFWYSARQVARMAAVESDPEDSDDERDLLAAPNTRLVALKAWSVLIGGAIATFGLLAGLWFLAPNPLGGAGPLAGAVAFWSVFISIIALPHIVIGSWFDRDRGIWYVP